VRAAPRQLVLRADASYIIVGGFKGLCGSLAIYLARLGAGHLVVMCRSGFADDKSQAVLKNINAAGCRVEQVQGDVCVLADVQRAFKAAPVPVRGVIQGAMVLRVSTRVHPPGSLAVLTLAGQNICLDDGPGLPRNDWLQSPRHLESPQRRSGAGLAARLLHNAVQHLGSRRPEGPSQLCSSQRLPGQLRLLSAPA
jgi:KR domain